MVWHSQEAAKSTATPGKAAPKSEEAKGRALLGGLMPIWVWKKFTFFFCFGALFSFICQPVNNPSCEDEHQTFYG